MSAHDLHDERPLVGGGRRYDAVDGLDDPVQGGVRADGHIGAAEVWKNKSRIIIHKVVE